MTAFSATATKTITVSRDTIIPLPKPVAKEVAKDLIRKDSLETVVNTQNDIIKLLNDNLRLKDSIITNRNGVISLFEHKEKNYNTVIGYKDLQISNQSLTIKTLSKENKKIKVRGITTNSILGAALLYFVYTSIKSSIK